MSNIEILCQFKKKTNKEKKTKKVLKHDGGHTVIKFFRVSKKVFIMSDNENN